VLHQVDGSERVSGGHVWPRLLDTLADRQHYNPDARRPDPTQQWAGFKVVLVAVVKRFPAP